MSHLNEQWQDKIEHNLYFTLRGCEQDGYYKVPKVVINSIMNWAGSCTNPTDGEDYYKNPRTMFVALDLIYTMLDNLQRHGLHSSKWAPDGHREWYIPKISEFTTKDEDKDE